jgi:hypothetical protein
MSSLADTDATDGDDDGGGALPEGMLPGGDDALLRDYLYKMTRDGRWQRRWFETNGIFLTYYKSRKREKLLAALSLLQVGAIKPMTPPEDSDLNNREGWFTIQLNSRVYTLRARSDAEAEKWVTGLSEIKLQNPDTGKAFLSSIYNDICHCDSSPSSPSGLHCPREISLHA